MNKLARLRVGCRVMLCCAVGRQGWEYLVLRFIRSELRSIINCKVVGVERSMSNIRTFLRPKVLRYTQPPKIGLSRRGG